MPGGRLTQQDRQQIALGLADGLAYAEIARRLDRPTSTVTREVMRNGGPVAYRGDLAHHATEHRARRRAKAAPGQTSASRPADGRDTDRDTDAVRAYEDTFAGIFMQSGLPRMTARALASLYTTDTGSLTAAEIARRLQISPGSVSKAVAFLDSQGLIRRERDERRRERYVVDDDVLYQSVMASARSTAQLGDIARQGVDILGRDTPAAARLENIARFVTFVSENMARAADQARDILHTKPGAPAGSAS
ncbi:GbsR/MarR family transcriptional regulator [Virgisporangium ochraceum]|uniref:MarR family transcriptional regulator n=1 Tax=Virgisporangium ochraceum TaxID=65505 RepID=A0A8J3ZZ48_9ACTN|nr:helix-turn-helix domain-containing protein [Virgisporangium ochraceum]GIJ72839.1 MarR family transcriptional regulator [Virgisporangium ochraceum]